MIAYPYKRGGKNGLVLGLTEEELSLVADGLIVATISSSVDLKYRSFEEFSIMRVTASEDPVELREEIKAIEQHTGIHPDPRSIAIRASVIPHKNGPTKP